MVEVAASDSAAPDQSGRPLKLVCFRLHGQEYALDIADVKETMTLRPITRVFLTPPWLAGIINLRGDIVAVLDLAQLLGMPAVDITGTSRIIICRHRDQVAGLVVDELAELRSLDAADVGPAPATLGTDAAALLMGVATVEDGTPLSVLHLHRLFESDRLRALQRGEG